MKQNIYGYIRVSSRDQNIHRQIVSMEQFHIPQRNLFIDKQSGSTFDRPSYKKLIKRLKQGDILYIKSIDRLGRNYNEILEQWRYLTKELKINIVVLDMPLLDTRNENDLLKSFVIDIVLQILSFVAENERNNIRSRQAEGIEAAKKRGVRFGRPCKPLPENFDTIYKRWKRKELSIRQASKACNMPKSTFYNKALQYKNLQS